MFSEQQSAMEYGKTLSLETGKVERRHPKMGVWHPYQFHQSQRQAWTPSMQSAGHWSLGSCRSSDGEATMYQGAEESGSRLRLFKGPQGEGEV